jgi:hypothetical protein
MMQPSDRRELLIELDATKESYVREKLAFGGYVDWQVSVVQYWLGLRDTERSDRTKRGAARMHLARVVVAVLGGAGTVGAALLHWYSTR